MNEDIDDPSQEGDDYYAFLNLPRTASEEEITNAYRRLSRLYHPDKHKHPERKKEAEQLFNKTKKVYEALKDPHSRAIYDSLGTAGLETQGWEIVQRTKTPQEIREEYEQLARDREERKLQQRTNPKSSVVLNINATELFNIYDDDSPFFDLRDLFGFPHIEISGMSLSQSIDAPLTTRDTAILSGNLSSQNGTGQGNVNCSLRHVLNQNGWGEVEVGAGNGLNVSLKGLRTFSRGFFANGSVVTHFTPNRARLETNFTLANQLDKHTVGYLTWKYGMHSGMNTMIIHDTQARHVVASLNFGIPHTFFSLSYVHKMPSREAKFKLSGRAGTFGAMIEYGAMKKVSQHSSLFASMTVGVPTGITLKLKIFRASQTYSANILLCEDVLPAPIIYGTVVPLLGWIAIQKLVIQPYLKQQKQKELQKQREANKTRLAEKKQEAKAAVELMSETVKRIIDQEEAKKGLVIIQALYGNLVSDSSSREALSLSGTDDVDFIDVTIPLQCMVKDSKLILQDSTKSQLPGFYDPCPGEDNMLRVRYFFRAVLHQATIKDGESLRIPKPSHRIDE